MLDVSYKIDVKSEKDLEIIVSVLTKLYTTNPIYVVSIGHNYFIEFDSEYILDIEYEIIKHFPEYEFIDTLHLGRNDIRMIICMDQSPFSTDDWGRPLNSDNVNTTKYLVKKAQTISNGILPNSEFTVYFDEQEKKYTVNIANGINKVTEEKGFIVLGKDEEICINKLFTNEIDAFWSGYNFLKEDVNSDYEAYKRELKKRRKKERKKEK